MGQKVDPLSGEVFISAVYDPSPSDGMGEEKEEGDEGTEEEEEQEEDDEKKGKKQRDEFEEDLVRVQTVL